MYISLRQSLVMLMTKQVLYLTIYSLKLSSLGSYIQLIHYKRFIYFV